MKFKGTIIITDPCYVMRAKHHGTTPLTEDDWDSCGYGSNMEVFGIKNYITEPTIYGDWSCTTYKCENPKETVKALAAIDKYYYDKYEEYGGYNKITKEQDEALDKECKEKQDALNIKTDVLGEFCADAGLVSVFLFWMKF